MVLNSLVYDTSVVPANPDATTRHSSQHQVEPRMSEESQDPNKLYDAAIALKDSGDLEAAVEALFEILSIDNDHLHTNMALGVHLQKLGRIEESVKYAVRVTEIEPNDPFSFTQLSVIYQRCGRIPEAEDAMAKAHVLQGRPASTGQPPESKHSD